MILARALCDGDRRGTDVSLRLDEGQRRNARDDRYVVRLHGGKPNRRWQLEVGVQTQGGVSSASLTTLRTGKKGSWTSPGNLRGGRNRVEVQATRLGGRCEIRLDAKISPPRRAAVGGPAPAALASPAAHAYRSPILAQAPCDGDRRRTNVSLGLDDGANPSADGDRYEVDVDKARPNQRWRLRVAIDQPGDGSATTYPRVRTDANGSWTRRNDLGGGRHEIEVLADRPGASCEIWLDARISPLP